MTQVLVATNAITADCDTYKVALSSEDDKLPQPDMGEGRWYRTTFQTSKGTKKLLWYLFYGGLCALALWSHLNSPESEMLVVEPTAH